MSSKRSTYFRLRQTGVAKTRFAATAMSKYGKASNELFTQFVARVALEIPSATIAMFSKMKYINGSNFEKFREEWNAKYLGGFVVHSKAFDGLKGDFPIGFLVWKTAQQTLKVSKNLQGLGTGKGSFTEIDVDVLDKNAKPIGEKTFYNLPNDLFLSNWIVKPKANKQEVISLSNAVNPAKATSGSTKWSDGAIAHLVCDSNDFQNANLYTLLLSSAQGIGHKGAIYVTPENLWQAAIIYTVRRIIKPTWLNDRDQFLQPTKPLSDEFKSDCLIWMLFNGSNLTASADGLEWNGKTWSIVNHFIPFTEAEVGSPDRFESDFMVQYLTTPSPFKEGEQKPGGQNSPLVEGQGVFLSSEAKQVMLEGKKLWQAYFAHTDVKAVREELKLNRADVGWYQVRKALQARNASGDFVPVNFKPFEEAYKALTEKLQPMVYELGFLKV